MDGHFFGLSHDYGWGHWPPNLMTPGKFAENEPSLEVEMEMQLERKEKRHL
jgi:hypothetical protein